MTDIEYLDKRLRILLLDDYEGLLDELCKIGGSFNEFRGWTPLKLIALSYFIQPYLNIMRGLERKRGRTALVYIDLFAGSGINRVGKYALAGSPIVAIDCATKARRQFDYMFFVDSSPEHIDSLQARLDYMASAEIKEKGKLLPERKFAWIKENCEIKCVVGDANQSLESIVNFLNKLRYRNYLAFIDPYKWQIKWLSLERLLQIPYGDVFITHQASLIAKEIAREDLTEETKKEITDYFGVPEAEWSLLKKERDVRDFYIDRIREYRPYVQEITIRGKTSRGGTFKYYLIFATRKENPVWGEAVQRLKQIVESYSGDIVEHSLKYLYGDEVRLFDFEESD